MAALDRFHCNSITCFSMWLEKASLSTLETQTQIWFCQQYRNKILRAHKQVLKLVTPVLKLVKQVLKLVQ